MVVRKSQYEFKVIVRVDEDAWPNELRLKIAELLQDEELWINDSHKTLIDVHSVERIRDGY